MELFILVVLPLIGIFSTLIISDFDRSSLNSNSILWASLSLVWSIFLLSSFDNMFNGFQYFSSVWWSYKLGFHFTMGVDGLSIWFIILTNILILISVLLAAQSITLFVKWLYIFLFIIQISLIIVFCVLELILFYIFFEAILIPMFLLIIIWGSRERRIHAAYQFFLYTLLGSFMFLLSLFMIYSEIGTTNYFDMILLNLSDYHQIILGICLFIALGVKIPIFPFHIWLPEAHVEAPTIGSILLAGILLKMGAYGMLRFLLVLAPVGVSLMSSFIYLICIIGVFYTGLTTIRQIDMKKIIAYSSVGHMSFVVAGLFALNYEALEGATFLMITHGLVSPALFLCVGILYDRYGSRLYSYYGGMSFLMPTYAIFFFVFMLANFSLPGTCSFVAEILVVLGVFESNGLVALLLFLSGTLTLVYSLWLINRVLSGPLNKLIIKYSDLTKIEFFISFLLLVLVLLFGFYPSLIIEYMHIPIGKILMFYR